MWMYARNRRLVWNVADFDSLQTNPRKGAVPSETIKSLIDTEPGVVLRPPEVGLEDHVIQVRVGSASGANERDLEGKAHGDIEQGGVQEKVFVDGANGSCDGRKVVGESTADLPGVVFACLKSEILPRALYYLLLTDGHRLQQEEAGGSLLFCMLLIVF